MWKEENKSVLRWLVKTTLDWSEGQQRASNHHRDCPISCYCPFRLQRQPPQGGEGLEVGQFHFSTALWPFARPTPRSAPARGTSRFCDPYSAPHCPLCPVPFIFSRSSDLLSKHNEERSLGKLNASVSSSFPTAPSAGQGDNLIAPGAIGANRELVTFESIAVFRSLHGVSRLFEEKIKPRP